MPTKKNLSPEIPSIFVKQCLTAPRPQWAQQGSWRLDDLVAAIESSNALVAEHGKRFYQDLNVSPDTPFPYIRWQIDDVAGMGVRHDVPRSYIGKKVVRATIVTVRSYPIGNASYLPSDPAYQNMIQCVTGVGYTPIWNQAGVLLGHVSQSRWLEDHRLAYDDEDTNETITELGFVAEITYN